MKDNYEKRLTRQIVNYYEFTNAKVDSLERIIYCLKSKECQ